MQTSQQQAALSSTRAEMSVFRACPTCGTMIQGSISSRPGSYEITYDSCATCAEPRDYELPEIEREEC